MAAYLLAWMLAGLAMAVVWLPQAAAGWMQAIRFTLPLALLAGIAALSMHFVCRSFPLRPANWISALGRRGLAAGFLALLVCVAAALCNATGMLWGQEDWVPLSPGTWYSVAGGLVAVLGISALIHDALLAQQSLQEAAATEAQVRLLAHEMEIKALRNQLDPHFLFNSLNSVSSLIQIDPVAARAMTIDLAQFLRQTLSLGERERIRLEEELELLQHYLAIEQRRLGDRLHLSMDVEADCHAALLPPLILQPLVENAIKHGIRQLLPGGTIELGAHRRDASLVLRVSNPVPVQTRLDGSGLGQGLRLLRARLRTQYDQPASVAIDSTPDQFTVVVNLPWQS